MFFCFSSIKCSLNNGIRSSPFLLLQQIYREQWERSSPFHPQMTTLQMSSMIR